MLRILQAFAWMRWRVLVNSLERTGARDTLERFSIAIEHLGPLIAIVLLVPSTLAVAGLGAAAGYALADGAGRPLLFEIVRYLLAAALVLSIVGPIAMPAAERTNAVRLLLLPIPRPMLYAVQAAGAIADPWILLTIALVLLVPAGLAAGGALAAAAVALLGAVLFVALLVGLTALATSLLHLIVRDRRRGAIIALFFILVLPALGMLPAIFEAGRGELDERGVRKRRETPGWVRSVGRAAPYLPSEMYVTAVRSAATGTPTQSSAPLAGLAAGAIVLHVLGIVVYGWLLDSPGSASSRGRTARSRALRVPGVSPGTSAVAIAQLRLALRTPRGRSVVLSPLILVAMFGAMMYRGGGDMRLGLIALDGGLGLATFGAFGSLLTILPIAMNQFAVDGAGLTLVLLSPVSDRELLAGKAIGTGFIVAGPASLSMAGALLAFPGGSPWLWLAVPLALAATYILTAPAAAALSAIFPRAVDMNSIGRGSNAHGAAGFIGFVAVLAAGVPSALLVLLATRVLGQPALAPLFLIVWLGAATATAAALFVPVRKLFAVRRENLALVV